MKITDYNVIKSGEQELIDAITADLDWGVIEDIFKKEHHLEIEENVEYKKGDIVVHNDQVAYKLEFDVTVILSVLLDREGNYLSVTGSGDLNPLQDTKKEELLDEADESNAEPKNTYDTALSQFDSITTSDNDEVASSVLDTEDPLEKVSQIASQAGKMISNLEDRKTRPSHDTQYAT